MLVTSLNISTENKENSIVSLINSSCKIISFLFITEEEIELTEMRKCHERKASFFKLRKILHVLVSSGRCLEKSTSLSVMKVKDLFLKVVI